MNGPPRVTRVDEEVRRWGPVAVRQDHSPESRGGAEVEQQADVEAGGLETIDQVGGMRRCERFGRLALQSSRDGSSSTRVTRATRATRGVQSGAQPPNRPLSNARRSMRAACSGAGSSVGVSVAIVTRCIVARTPGSMKRVSWPYAKSAPMRVP